MNKGKLTLHVLVPVLFLALSSGVFAGCGLFPAKGTSGSWVDYRDARSLLAASERILVATYLDEEIREIPTVTADDGTVVGSVTERFRRFQIIEALRGDGDSGGIMHVVTSVGYKTALSGGRSKSYTYDVLDLTAEEDYVLFLDGGPKPEGYPPQYGDILWTRPGEPGVAQLDAAGRLTFIATDRYKNMMEAEGLETVEGSDAPFEMTKEDIATSTPSE